MQSDRLDDIRRRLDAQGAGLDRTRAGAAATDFQAPERQNAIRRTHSGIWIADGADEGLSTERAATVGDAGLTLVIASALEHSGARLATSGLS